MKTLRRISQISLLSISLILVSCNKDDEAPAVATAGANADSYITTKVDGNDFSTLVYGVSTASCSKVNAGETQTITILGGDLSANSVTIVLHNIRTAGTYTVNPDTDSLLNYSPGSGAAAFSTGVCDGSTGTINVTLIDDKKVEGTFTFTGKDTENCSSSKTITEGAFRGTWQQ